MCNPDSCYYDWFTTFTLLHNNSITPFFFSQCISSGTVILGDIGFPRATPQDYYYSILSSVIQELHCICHSHSSFLILFQHILPSFRLSQSAITLTDQNEISTAAILSIYPTRPFTTGLSPLFIYDMTHIPHLSCTYSSLTLSFPNAPQMDVSVIFTVTIQPPNLYSIGVSLLYLVRFAQDSIPSFCDEQNEGVDTTMLFMRLTGLTLTVAKTK